MMTRARILLVDQFAPWRDYLRARLRGYSHCEVVGESADGLDGVEKAQELQPDIILLDIALPQLNGIEVARKIRTVAPRSKILFLSVEDSSDLVEAAMKAGAHGYLAKIDVESKLLPTLDVLLAK